MAGSPPVPDDRMRQYLHDAAGAFAGTARNRRPASGGVLRPLPLPVIVAAVTGHRQAAAEADATVERLLAGTPTGR
jgi:hypothetical protein